MKKNIELNFGVIFPPEYSVFTYSYVPVVLFALLFLFALLHCLSISLSYSSCISSDLSHSHSVAYM